MLNLKKRACPPYHLALVIGGLSAELTMKTVKLASCKYYDFLPTSGKRYMEEKSVLLFKMIKC
jgi:tartrate dehydratase alpha subunit/fumarate hydratase class I-like protein